MITKFLTMMGVLAALLVASPTAQAAPRTAQPMTDAQIVAMLTAQDAEMSKVSRASAVFAATHYCDTDSQKVDDKWAPRIGKDVYWAVRHYFRACRPYDPGEHYAYVTPRWTVGSYNVEGGYMTCNRALRYINGVRFNLYMWRPYTGANFNPGSFYAPCDESTTNSDVQNYSTTMKLYFGPGNGDDRQPRWKVNVDIDMPAREDPHQSHWRRYSVLID